MRFLLPLLAVLASLTLAGRVFAFDPPPLTGYVTDPGDHLDESTRSALEANLRSIEAATGHQIVFLILDSLGGESIEDVAYTTAKEWKIGRAGKDDGVVVVLALVDRKIRIEVGKGVEDRLPDLRCADIIRGALAPALRQGDISTAVRDGSRAIADALGTDAPRLTSSHASGVDLPQSQSSDFDPFGFLLVAFPLTGAFVLLCLKIREHQRRPPGAWLSQSSSSDDVCSNSSRWDVDIPSSVFDWGSSGSSTDSGGSSDTSCSGGGGDFGGGGASGDF